MLIFDECRKKVKRGEKSRKFELQIYGLKIFCGKVLVKVKDLWVLGYARAWSSFIDKPIVVEDSKSVLDYSYF